MVFNYYIKTNKILNNNYHNIICEIIGIILDKSFNFNNLSKLKIICEKIFINCYNLMSLFVEYLIKCLSSKFSNNYDLFSTITKLSCDCDINLSKSTVKYFIHLENYIVKLILLINN